MYSTGFFVVIVSLAVIIVPVCILIYKEYKRNKSSKCFFEEAEKNFGYTFAEEEKNAYYKAKEEIRRKYLNSLKNKNNEGKEKKKDHLNEEESEGKENADTNEGEGDEQEEEDEEDDGGNPENSWMRGIQNEDRRVLKVQLLRRGIRSIPEYSRIFTDMNGIDRLYNRRIVSNQLWNNVLSANMRMRQELREIQYEANCLEEGWGSKILEDASVLYRYQQHKENEKRREIEEEKSRQRKIKMEEKLIEQKKKQMEEQFAAKQRKADRMAQLLIEQENKKKPRSLKTSN